MTTDAAGRRPFFDRFAKGWAVALVLMLGGLGTALYLAHRSTEAGDRARAAESFLLRFQSEPEATWEYLLESVQARLPRERMRQIRDATPAVRDLASFRATEAKGTDFGGWAKGQAVTRQGASHVAAAALAFDLGLDDVRNPSNPLDLGLDQVVVEPPQAVGRRFAFSGLDV